MRGPTDSSSGNANKGELLLGSWLSWSYGQVTEMVAKSGLDFVVVDMEHTSTGTAGMAEQLQLIDLCGVAPLVRVGANDPLLIKRALDAGAHGVIVPMVCSAEEAKAAVSAVHYPPVGTRGVGLSRAQGFGMSFDAYRESAADTLVTIVQIEHHEAVARLDEILAVDGVDGWIVGPYDLSGSLGKPGQFDDPEVASAMTRVEDLMKVHDKPGGFHVVHPDHDHLRRCVDKGARLLAYGTDMLFLAHMLQRELGFLRSLKSPG